MRRSSPLLLAIALAPALAAPSLLRAQDVTAATAACYGRPMAQRAACIASDLDTLQAEVPRSFDALRARLSPSGAADLSADQQAWQSWVQAVCPSPSPNTNQNASQNADQGSNQNIAQAHTACLDNRYSQREQQLTAGTRSVNGMLLFTRARFRVAPGKVADVPAALDPGFGTGTLAWPQIDAAADTPNPACAAFNAAVKARAAKLAVGFSKDKNATFDTAVDDSGTIDGFFSIIAANHRLLEITLTDSTYAYGGAHPITTSTSFAWWLDRNRELSTGDVFLPNSGWQDHLVPLVISRLQSRSELQPVLWKGKELEDSVRTGIAAPTAWTLTRDGLAITFGEYAVAAYVAGMPTVHIPWDKLEPFLDPGLHPSTLPAPLPASR